LEVGGRSQVWELLEYCCGWEGPTMHIIEGQRTENRSDPTQSNPYKKEKNSNPDLFVALVQAERIDV
jgi:hypothetical protein